MKTSTPSRNVISLSIYAGVAIWLFAWGLSLTMGWATLRLGPLAFHPRPLQMLFGAAVFWFLLGVGFRPVANLTRLERRAAFRSGRWLFVAFTTLLIVAAVVYWRGEFRDATQRWEAGQTAIVAVLLGVVAFFRTGRLGSFLIATGGLCVLFFWIVNDSLGAVPTFFSAVAYTKTHALVTDWGAAFALALVIRKTRQGRILLSALAVAAMLALYLEGVPESPWFTLNAAIFATGSVVLTAFFLNHRMSQIAAIPRAIAVLACGASALGIAGAYSLPIATPCVRAYAFALWAAFVTFGLRALETIPTPAPDLVRSGSQVASHS